MKYSQILFNQAMMKAYRAGLKTQTRRVAKDFVQLTPTYFDFESKSFEDDCGQWKSVFDFCRYGRVGDRLWFRENWRPCYWDADFEEIQIEYQAGGVSPCLKTEDLWADDFVREARHEHFSSQALKKSIEDSTGKTYINLYQEGENILDWKPSIHLPFRASRYQPEIISLDFQFLHEITEEDAIAEGVGSIEEYKKLWDKLNAKRGFSWSRNPPVWRIEFDPCVPF